MTRHPQADSVLDSQQDYGRYDKGPGSGGDDTDYLDTNLLYSRRHFNSLAKADADKEAGSQRAPSAAHAVHTPDGQGVVNLQLEQQFNCSVADNAGPNANDNRRHCTDKPGGRGNGYQAGHRAGGRADDAGPLAENPGHNYPGNHGGGSSGIGNHKGVNRYAIGGQGAAGVETEPAKPEQPGPQDYHRDVVGRHRLFAKADALADNQRGGQGGDAGIDVYHCAAGKVQRAQAAQPATAPNPMGQGSIHDSYPQHGEDNECAELHPLGKGAGNQRRGDDGEHTLEYHKSLVRNVVRVWAGLRGADPGQAEPLQVTYDTQSAHIGAEGQAVTPQYPHHAHQAHAHQAVHYGRAGVLAADQAAIEESQPRGHKQDQG